MSIAGPGPGAGPGGDGDGEGRGGPHVLDGAPPDDGSIGRHAVLSGVAVAAASVSAQDNRCYVVTCRETGEQLVVDAADRAEQVLALAAEAADRARPGAEQRGEGAAGRRAHVRLVVTTHGHWDHHRALAEVLRHWHCPSAAGADDAADLPVRPSLLLTHGDRLTVGRVGVDVVHLRGHTPGSVALVVRDPSDPGGAPVAVTGDSLFPGGVGNTWGDADRFASLLRDVTERLFDVLPDGTWVLPGHGATTTLGAERGSLPEWERRGW